MADLIARFKGDTSDLDQKIKKGSQTLLQMKADCEKVGGAFINLDKEQVEFIRSLGRMETGAKSAKGTIAELSKSFTDMSAVYNRLTEEEKADEGGRALRASLDQLKNRIKEGKAELKSIDGEIGNSQSLLGQLSDKFGVNITKLASWGAALGAGKVALDVVKDAFFASEANLDEWNRTVYAGESAWDAFLTSINTGDISGFLSRIDSIVDAAKEAYNEMDRLSTQKAINNPAIKAQEAENERFRAMLRYGRYIAPNDGREASMEQGQVLTDAQKQRIAQQLESGMQRLNGFVRDEIEQTTKSIDALYKQQAAQLGMSLEDFRAGTANMSEFDKRMEGYRKYLQYKTDHTVSVTMQSSAGAYSKSYDDGTVNPYEEFAPWGVFKDDGKLLTQINNYINQRAALQSQNYSNIANAYRAINKANGTGGGSGTLQLTPLQLTTTDLAAYWQKQAYSYGNISSYALDTPVVKTGKVGELSEAQMDFRSQILQSVDNLDELGKHTQFVAENFQSLDKAAKLRKKQEEDDANREKERGEGQTSAVEVAAQMTSGLSSLAGGIEGLGIDLGDGFRGMIDKMGAVITIITSIQTILSAIEAIQTIGTFLPFANGGIVRAANGFVPGNYMSGDNFPALLNSGELVLNKAQQGVLASQLSGVGQNNMHLETTIHGEDLRILLRNNSRRRGHGEYITTR